MAHRRTNAPSSDATDGLVLVSSTALEASHILKATNGNLYLLTVLIGATGGFLMLFDATSVPADGAVTPAYALPIPSAGGTGFVAIDWASAPMHFNNGVIAVFSTTGPFTKTASTTAAFFAGVK